MTRKSILISFVMLNLWQPLEQAKCGFTPDAVVTEAGYGSGIPRTNLFRFDTVWHWWQHSLGRGLGLESSWEASLGRWDGDQELLDIGISPVFRITAGSGQRAISPYLEACIGFHYISKTRMYNREFSTNFQFGDHLAVGFQWGKHLDIAYKFQHLSNGSIKRPNAGMNFHILRISYWI